MKADDIKDEESLRAWLETRPKADAVAIAHRAALRMFPLWATSKKTRRIPSGINIILSTVWASLFLDWEQVAENDEIKKKNWRESNLFHG